MIQSSSYENQPVEKVGKRYAQGGHLVFQNEAKFSHREAYLPMKIPTNLVKLAGVILH